jgi:hypothetical protein
MYLRIWACLKLDKSGYALTATLSGDGTTVITADIKLDRYDAGTPTELWTETGVEVQKASLGTVEEEEASLESSFAITVFEGVVAVWQEKVKKHPKSREWFELGNVTDSTYKKGFVGAEGEGEIRLEEREEEPPVGMNVTAEALAVPPAAGTGMAMML